MQSVSVRARATGYLMQMPFKEGTEVKEGELLFTIDPRPYQALVDESQSQVELNEAILKLAQKTYERDKAVGPAIGQQQLDQDAAQVEEAQSRVRSAQAAVQTAKLNLDFTKVKAPIAGRISRYYYTLGNLVMQDQTMLTTIVSMNPMYVYFDMDERTYNRLLKSINEGRLKLPSETSDVPVLDIPVSMALEGEDGFPHKGRINFINNQVNPSTGTIAIRGIFDNERPKGGAWRLTPGMFVRIRLPISEPHKAMLVIDRAIGSDQGMKFLYVIDAEKKAQYRRIVTGPLQEDGLRVIESGLKPEDWVAVGGLQQLRAKTEIQPEQVPMPTLALGSTIISNRRKPQPPPPGDQKAVTPIPPADNTKKK